MDKGLTIERTQVDPDVKVDRGAVKKFETRVSPLQFAAAKGYADITEILIGWGANVNLSGTHETDLHFLIKYLEFGLPPLLLAAKGLANDPIELNLPIKVVPSEVDSDYSRTCHLLISAGAQVSVSAEEPLLFYFLAYPSLLQFAVQVLSILGKEQGLRSLTSANEDHWMKPAASDVSRVWRYCSVVGVYPIRRLITPFNTARITLIYCPF